jgi:hypothetical protein
VPTDQPISEWAFQTKILEALVLLEEEIKSNMAYLQGVAISISG